MAVLHWFRQDLRLADNAALSAAVQTQKPLILLYVFDETHTRPMGEAQRWWLHHSLHRLMQSLAKHGLQLVLRRGNPRQILKELTHKRGVGQIFCNRVPEPQAMSLEDEVAEDCAHSNIGFDLYNSCFFTQAGAIETQSGAPYQVFTPYYKAVKSLIKLESPLPEPEHWHPGPNCASDDLNAWQLLPHQPDWSQGFNIWMVGESAARQKLHDFIEQDLVGYQDRRDFPAEHHTSELSPHLHFGEISPRDIWYQIQQSSHAQAGEPYLRQMIWREFSYHILHLFPKLAEKNFREEFNRFKWRQAPAQLKAWQRGLTGFPLVDAGMRQLWQTGYMHNRVRMVTASFLIKDLLIDWREGEQWFWNTLLDADLANNAFGWQWAAGSGADAAPFFRIFNPELQSKKFDATGEYIKRWLPELASLPEKYIHAPVTAPASVLKDANIELGSIYPHPLVDHHEARAKALAQYETIKGKG